MVTVRIPRPAGTSMRAAFALPEGEGHCGGNSCCAGRYLIDKTLENAARIPPFSAGQDVAFHEAPGLRIHAVHDVFLQHLPRQPA